MAILYEVNLNVEQEIAGEFLAWLGPHIKEMLKFQGFERASLWSRKANSEGLQQWSVHYHVKTMEDLQTYFDLHAERMRGEAVKLFGTRFQAERRIFELEENAKLD